MVFCENDQMLQGHHKKLHWFKRYWQYHTICSVDVEDDRPHSIENLLEDRSLSFCPKI